MSGVLIQLAIFVVVWRLGNVPWAVAAVMTVLCVRLASRILRLQRENQELRHALDSPAEVRLGDAVDDVEPESGMSRAVTSRSTHCSGRAS